MAGIQNFINLTRVMPSMERENAFALLDRTDYALSLGRENVELVLYTVVSFFIPFLLTQPQLFVGSLVNCALVLAALNLRGRQLLPMVLLPSLGVLAGGFVFGASTGALIFMVPFIWLGNAVLVLGIKEICLARKNNFALALGESAVAKSALLFVAAFALLHFGLVPAAFLTAMGIFQLYTALIGGAAAFAVQAVKKRFVA
jgi:hypothetical protein